MTDCSQLSGSFYKGMPLQWGTVFRSQLGLLLAVHIAWHDGFFGMSTATGMLLVQDKVPSHLHDSIGGSLGASWRSTVGATAAVSSAGLLDPSLPSESLAVACEARRAALLERESLLQVCECCLVCHPGLCCQTLQYQGTVFPA